MHAQAGACQHRTRKERSGFGKLKTRQSGARFDDVRCGCAGDGRRGSIRPGAGAIAGDAPPGTRLFPIV